MPDVFISYARSTEPEAHAIAEALRARGHVVWRDDQIAAHQAFGKVIEERLAEAKVVLVLWSADAAESEWVRSEASRARAMGKLVQLTLDRSPLPMPFDQIQCANLAGWRGGADTPGWRQVLAAIADLHGAPADVNPALPLALPLPGKPSIAVLPFANLSGDPEQEYFADGMVEEIATALSRIRSIFVIAGGSSLSLKGGGVGAQEAARRLGVSYVLEGSVRKAGGRVRIAVKLVDGVNGEQLWAERFEDTLEDVFALQDHVALSVAGRIEPTVQMAETRRASARPTENMGSYDLYLQAWPLHRAYTEAATLKALDFVERAVTLDPAYGSALVLAAVCHNLIDLYGWSKDRDLNRQRGIDMARRAVAAAPDDASVLAHAAFAVAHLEHDDAAAVSLVERAIALNPGCSAVWFMSGLVRVRIGETDLAVAHLETAMRLDPIGPDLPNQIGFMAWARFQQGRFAEAIALAKEFVRQKDHPRGYAFLAASYGHLGQTDAGREALDRYRGLAHQPVEAFARSFILNPAGLQLFLDGIALAEGGRQPAETTG
ncbi:TIR domain-containing protein [Phenylobacterium sp.]|jgi:adenylate cyclase|uniref:TIR domain-containing protein n=1 Tax=Phenylobacterium sp. TaxID=1871053 RepID=UPI002F418C58